MSPLLPAAWTGCCLPRPAHPAHHAGHHPASSYHGDWRRLPSPTRCHGHQAFVERGCTGIVGRKGRCPLASRSARPSGPVPTKGVATAPLPLLLFLDGAAHGIIFACQNDGILLLTIVQVAKGRRLPQQLSLSSSAQLAPASRPPRLVVDLRAHPDILTIPMPHRRRNAFVCIPCRSNVFLLLCVSPSPRLSTPARPSLEGSDRPTNRPNDRLHGQQRNPRHRAAFPHAPSQQLKACPQTQHESFVKAMECTQNAPDPSLAPNRPAWTLRNIFRGDVPNYFLSTALLPSSTLALSLEAFPRQQVWRKGKHQLVGD
jgi:hypothetical protein